MSNSSSSSNNAPVAKKPTGGMFSGFLSQVAVFNDIKAFVEIDDESVREFTQFLHTSKGGSNLFAQLAVLNKMMGGMINCLGQGFLSFNETGTVSKIASKACLELLESNPSQRKIWEVLKASGTNEDTLKGWVELIFQNKVDFDSLAALGPKKFNHSEGRAIYLEYYPVRASDGKVTDVVVVATDHTERELAAKQAEHERKNVKMIIQIVKQKKSFASFVVHFRKEISRYREIALMEIPSFSDVQEYVRFLHTMKGASSIFAIEILVNHLHSLENEWTFLKTVAETAESNQSVYRDLIAKQTAGISETLETFLLRHKDIVGGAISQTERVVEIPLSRIEKMKKIFENSGANASLISQVTELAKEPIATYLLPYTELATQVAESQNKMIYPIQIENGDISIFPEPYEDLIGSFVHIFRNSIDHGIESPAEREKAGKPASGRIGVKIQKRNDNGKHWLDFNFEDDGRGIDPRKIRAQLENSRIPRNWANMEDEEVIQKIFEPGFSTKGAVTAISGRGIGLDAVQSEAKRMGGSARVKSTQGQGCYITVSVPDVDQFLQRAIFHP